MDHMKARFGGSIKLQRGRDVENGCKQSSNGGCRHEFVLDVCREVVPRHHNGCRWGPIRYNVPHNFGYFSAAIISKQWMAFYSGLGGIVGLAERHVSYFHGIFILMGRSLQSLQAKQLMFCEGEVPKAMRFRQCTL